MLALLLLCASGAAWADLPDYDGNGLPNPSPAALLPAGGDLVGHRRWLVERGVDFNRFEPTRGPVRDAEVNLN